MLKTLYELWEENDMDLTNVLNTTQEVFFNGRNFSDEEFFTKNKEYKVVQAEPMGVNLLADGGYEIFIYPDGLTSFDIDEKK